MAAKAETAKTAGNTLLKDGKSVEALKKYQEGLKGLGPRGSKETKEATAIRLGLNLNAALACIKAGDNFEEAESFATEALHIDATCVKAFYRRGVARSNIPDLAGDAIADLEMALRLDPKSGDARAELNRLKNNELSEDHFVAPGDANPIDVQAYHEENALRLRTGYSRIAWGPWTASIKKRVASEAVGQSFGMRVNEVANKGRFSPKAVAKDAPSASCATLNKALATLGGGLKKVNAGAYDNAKVVEDPQAKFYTFAGGKDGVTFVAPGVQSFDGKTCKDVPYSAEANPAETFTVDADVQCTAGGGSRSPVSSRDKKGKRLSAGYAFFVEPEGKWSFWVGVGSFAKKLTGPDVELGAWTHLRGVVNVGARTAEFYVNHKLVDTMHKVDFTPNKEQPLRIGAGGTECDDPKFWFIGSVRNVAVWDGDKKDQTVSSDILAGYHTSKAASKPLQLADVLGKDNGQSANSALSTAVRFAAASAGGAVNFSSGRGKFHKLSMDFMGIGTSAANVPQDSVHALFVNVDLQAQVSLQKNGDQLQLAYGKSAASSRSLSAVILQSGGSFRILYDLNGVCALGDALKRQDAMRPKASGWINAKDVAMWLNALEVVAFSADVEEVETAANTVFLYGYWCEKGYLSPDVKTVDFPSHAREGPRIRAALVDRLDGAKLAKGLAEIK